MSVSTHDEEYENDEKPKNNEKKILQKINFFQKKFFSNLSFQLFVCIKDEEEAEFNSASN